MRVVQRKVESLIEESLTKSFTYKKVVEDEISHEALLHENYLEKFVSRKAILKQLHGFNPGLQAGNDCYPWKSKIRKVQHLWLLWADSVQRSVLQLTPCDGALHRCCAWFYKCCGHVEKIMP
ncbi:uncharacterized protein [Ptychodera flava]|uniref:uncharacterized protein n=1 Tax=Ptychodera flava TaxID=63121 RepID=UPI00396A89C1